MKSKYNKNWFYLPMALLMVLSACSEPQGDVKTKGTSASQAQKASETTAQIDLLKPVSADEDGKRLELARSIFKPLPSQDEINAKNPVTEAQINLGHQLYFDNRLSKNGNQSCNSCHNLARGGVDNLSFSPGSEFSLGGRNAPTVLNAALQTSQFWDGRAKDLKEQAGGPLLNPVEMGLPDEQTAVNIVKSIPDYARQFNEAFPDSQGITFDQITTVIAAFEQTLITPSPFDDYLRGEVSALTEQQRRGLTKFIDNGCIACHKGVNLGGDSFQKFGLVDGPYWKFTGSVDQDEGRFQVTKVEDDKYVFRVPDLRNIANTYPYFHDGSVWSLEKAIEIMGQAQLGKKLPSEDIEDISAFLKSTSGTLHEKARLLPQLPISGPDTPKPALSKTLK